jgi:hypothetical protein
MRHLVNEKTLIRCVPWNLRVQSALGDRNSQADSRCCRAAREFAQHPEMRQPADDAQSLCEWKCAGGRQLSGKQPN